jgi:hypothetical protein
MRVVPKKKRRPDLVKGQASMSRKVKGDLYERWLPCGQPAGQR